MAGSKGGGFEYHHLPLGPTLRHSVLLVTIGFDPFVVGSCPLKATGVVTFVLLSPLLLLLSSSLPPLLSLSLPPLLSLSLPTLLSSSLLSLPLLFPPDIPVVVVIPPLASSSWLLSFVLVRFVLTSPLSFGSLTCGRSLLLYCSRHCRGLGGCRGAISAVSMLSSVDAVCCWWALRVVDERFGGEIMRGGISEGI